MFLIYFVIPLLTLALLVGVPVLAFVALSMGRRLGAIERGQAALQSRLATIEAAGGTPQPSADRAGRPALDQPPGKGSEPVARTEPADRPSAVPKVGAAGGAHQHPTQHPTQGPAPRPLPGEATSDESLEQQLGTRWAVWLGGAALALGGIYLVKHAIDAGLLTPMMRVTASFLLGLVLAGTGTWMNLVERRGRRAQAEAEAATGTSSMAPAAGAKSGASAHIPSVLTAAGTAVLFGSVYAAHALYGLIDAGPAFILLGTIGVSTMLSAALHGPALAGLGLAGSYITPLLIVSTAASPWPLVVYLTVVAVAAVGLAGLRGWGWLALTAVAGACVWGLLMIGKALVLDRPATDIWYLGAMVHTGVQTMLAVAALLVSPARYEAADPRAPDRPDWAAATALAALAALAVLVLSVVPLPEMLGIWALFVMAMCLLLLTAAGSTAHAPVALVAGAFVLCALLLWPGVGAPPPTGLRWPGLDSLIRLPDVIHRFALIACVGSAATAGLGVWQLSRRGWYSMQSAACLSLAAVLTPLLALVVAYLRITQFGTAISFSLLACGLALAFAWGAGWFDRREAALAAAGAEPQVLGTARLVTGVLAAAAMAALALALVAGLQRGYLTVGFALAALATAYIATRKDIPVLRHGAGVLALVVLGRIVWDPRIMGADLGSLPILNWLLVGYGVPAVAFWLAADMLRLRIDDWSSRLLEGLAVLFGWLLVFWQLRHWLGGGDPLVASTGHVEAGLQAVIGLGFMHVLQHLGARRHSVVLRFASYVFAVMSGLIVILGLGLAHNPLLTAERVTGGVPLSSLVPAYLLPGLMALFASRHARGSWPDEIVSALAVAALVLIFAYVTLEVRHAFQGEILRFYRPTSGPEMWSFTVAWLMLAIVYLGYGLLRGSVAARGVSGVLLGLTVVKVGLIDLADVQGLWRALSFICLGAVLIGIGLVYQRLVFAPRQSSVSS